MTKPGGRQYKGMRSAALANENLRDEMAKKTCPVCGKAPYVRYYDMIKKHWVYKHQTREKGFTETEYHFAKL